MNPGFFRPTNVMKQWHSLQVPRLFRQPFCFSFKIYIFMIAQWLECVFQSKAFHGFTNLASGARATKTYPTLWDSRDSLGPGSWLSLFAGVS